MTIPVLLTKLDAETNGFIASLVTKGEYKSKVVTLALAYALSKQLPMPCEAIDDISIYFALKHKADAINKLTAINELISVDIDGTIELAKKFYGYRYSVYKGIEVMPLIFADTAVEDFFGISKYICPDIRQLIKEQNTNLTNYINKFDKILVKLNTEAT
jgi:hypothetical protein